MILEGSAAWLWNALAEPATVDELAAAAAAASDAGVDTIRHDLRTVLADWRRQRLVTAESGSG